jgi:hypothetical protein
MGPTTQEMPMHPTTTPRTLSLPRRVAATVAAAALAGGSLVALPALAAAQESPFGGERPSLPDRGQFGGELPSLGGGERPSLPDRGQLGGELPSLGGGELPSLGGGELPSLGGGELPSFGGELPSFGGEGRVGIAQLLARLFGSIGGKSGFGGGSSLGGFGSGFDFGDFGGSLPGLGGERPSLPTPGGDALPEAPVDEAPAEEAPVEEAPADEDEAIDEDELAQMMEQFGQADDAADDGHDHSH